MHPRIAELVSFLSAEREAVEAAFESIPEGLREQRPSPEAWSAAELMDHLAKMEASVVRLVGRRAEVARLEGLSPESDESSVLGRLDHDLIGGTGKLVAPDSLLPSPDVRAADAAAALKQTRVELNAVLATVDGLALGEIIHTHEMLGDLDLYQWVLFIGLHERRHARQIRRLAEWSRTEAAGGVGGDKERRTTMDDA